MNKHYNPYQGCELKVPVQYKDKVDQYTQKKQDEMGNRKSPSHAPFNRMVDMWFLALCLGARKGELPTDSDSGNLVKFMEGTVLASDPWRIELISLLAIGYHGKADIIEKPNEIIHFCNGLAAQGFPELIEMLEAPGPSEPIWKLSDNLMELLTGSQKEMLSTV